MANALELRKGVRVKVVRLVHDNPARAWPFQMDEKEGTTGTVVTGPFKGNWFLVALDCDRSVIGSYRRFVSLTPEEIERA